mgnify:FL=1
MMVVGWTDAGPDQENMVYYAPLEPILKGPIFQTENATVIPHLKVARL